VSAGKVKKARAAIALVRAVREVATMDVPSWLPRRYARYWRHPWLEAAAHSRGFRRVLLKHGYLSPHFTLEEARCKDGTPVPASLRHKCQGHAFRLERIRRWTGPMPTTSWFRTRSHNTAVGGASRSRHMEAIATDHPKSWVDRHGGQARLRAIAVAANCRGIGSYPGGAMHFDSRPTPVVFWTSF
jgi:hypothetical protein